MKNKNGIRRRGLAVLLVMAMCTGLLAQGTYAEGKEPASSSEKTTRVVQTELFDITAKVKNKETAYAASGERKAENVLKDLSISFSSVISAISSDSSVMEVREQDGGIYLLAKEAGRAKVTVTINRSTEIPIDIVVKKAVYVNPLRGSDSYDGQSASVDGGGVGPLKTITKGIQMLGKAGVIYVLGGAETIPGSGTLNGRGKDITVKNYPDYDGALFSVPDNSSLSLTELTLCTKTDRENNIIQLMENATLSIGNNVSVSTNAIIQLGNGANPVELNAVPSAGMVYKLAADNAADQKVLVHTNGRKNVLKYFALSEKQAKKYSLAINGSGDIIMVERLDSGETSEGGSETLKDAVYLDGEYGQDYHSGASANSAVATYEKAVQLCKEYGIKKIKICGTVSISKEAVWDAEGITISNEDEFNGTMIDVDGSKFTLKMNMEVSGGCGIFSSGNSTITLDPAYVLTVNRGGIGIVVNSGSMQFNTGNLVVKGYSTGIEVREGFLSMSGSARVDVRTGKGVRVSGGQFTLSGAGLLGGEGQIAVQAEKSSTFMLANDIDTTEVLLGDLSLCGTPVTLIREPAQDYHLRLRDFQQGDVVVSGGKVKSEDSAKHFLVSGQGEIYRDATANNMRYRADNAVFLDAYRGNDANDGRTQTTAVKTLEVALQRVQESDKIDTIYLLSMITIQEDITVGDRNKIGAKDLKILPYASMTQMFLVKSGTLTLDKATVIGVGTVNGTIYKATAIQINETDAAVRTTEYTKVSVDASDDSSHEVVVMDGLLDMQGGEIRQVLIQNNSSKNTNGQIRMYPETKLPEGIRIEADTPVQPPVLAGGNLTGHKAIPLSFNTTDPWYDQEIVRADGVPSMAGLASYFRLPTGTSLYAGEESSGQNTTSLYLQRDKNAVYWATSGDDANDGHSRENPVQTFHRAWELASGQKDGYIIICGEICVSGTEEWKGGPVTLDGYTWTPVCYQDREPVWETDLIRIEGGGSLTVRDLTIDGDGALLPQIFKYGIAMQASAELYLTGTTTICNIHGSGAVSIATGSTCKIDGDCKIMGNTAYSNGGGLNVGGKLDLGGNAQILNNTAVSLSSGFGGGIHVVGEGEVQIHDHVRIEGNEATRYGGGIYAKGNSLIRIYGNVLIKGNKTVSGGGGIAVGENGRGSISGDVRIEGNTAMQGGGIYIATKEKFLITGHTEISGNRATSEGTNGSTSNGGGIANYGSDCTIQESVRIHNNTASEGGGIFNAAGAKLTLEGMVEITENTGCGIKVAYVKPSSEQSAPEEQIGEVTIRGSVKVNNNSSGGIISGGNLTIKDNVQICGNESYFCGGGIYVQANTCIIEGNVRISGNKVKASANIGNYEYGHGEAIYCGSTSGVSENHTRAYSATVILRGGIIEGEIFIDDPEVWNDEEVKGGLFLQGSSCQVKDTIVLIWAGNGSGNPIRVSGAMTDTGNTYKVRLHRTFYPVGTVTQAGAVVVKPGGTMTDVSQYIQYFSYDSDLATLEKSGEKIVLANAVYVDGQQGDDENDGSSPAKAKKKLPELLAESTTYYICGKVTMDESDARIVGYYDSSRIIRYTGFSVQGTPYTAYRGDLIEVAEGASLQVTHAAISGRRSKDEDVRASGSLIVCRGELKLSDKTTLTDNPGACIRLAEGCYVDTDNTVGASQEKRITVELEQPEPGAVVVKGRKNNKNVERFGLVPSQEEKYRLEVSGNDLILGDAQNVYLDPALGSDASDGSTPQEPVKTLERAHEVLGRSGGTVYVMSTVPVTSGKEVQLGQDNIRYQAYTEGITMFTVGSGATLAMTGITMKGDDKASRLIQIADGGKLTAEGDTILSGSTGYAIENAGDMELGGSPVIHGILYLGGNSYITALDNLYLSTDDPLQLLLQHEPEEGEAPRLLIQNTTLPTGIVQYENAGFVLEHKQDGTDEQVTGIYLSKKKEAQRIYVDGQKGDDTADGLTPEHPVRTLAKAYEKLDRVAGERTGSTEDSSESVQETREGQIVIVGTIDITERTVLTEKYVQVEDQMIELANLDRVTFLRYARVEGSAVADCRDTLFHVTSDLTLAEIEIDGHSRKLGAEAAIRGSASLITVAPEGSLVTKNQVTLTDNDTADGQGGAVMNHGFLGLSGVTVTNCKAKDGAAIYQDGSCEIVENNQFGNLEIYLPEGKIVDVSGENNGILYLCPQERSARVKVARAINDAGTGESILLSLRLAQKEDLSSYDLLAEGDSVYMVKGLLPSTITLQDKTVVSDGTCISIDEAVVTGSTGPVSYTYYTDPAATIETGTGEGEGRAAYEGGAPSEAGTYYVVAEVEADDTYVGAVSTPAVLTLLPSNSVEITLRLDDRAYTGQKLVLKPTEAGGAAAQQELEELSGHGVHFATGLEPGTYSIYQGESGEALEDTGKRITVNASDHQQLTLEYYTVIYDANTTDEALTGMVPESQIYRTDTVVQADQSNAGQLARPGYILDGWALSADGEKVDSMTVSAEQHVFYACWKKEETELPTQTPTEEPTQAPTEEPTQEPTEEPTQTPTEGPTQMPTKEPTQMPTEEPTQAPTKAPVPTPVNTPAATPTRKPEATPVVDEDDLSNLTEEEIKNRIDEAKKKNWEDTPIALVDYEILHTKNDDDIGGSVYVLLCARVTKRTKNSEKLTWNKIPGADGYIIYGNKCGLKNRYKKIKTVGKSKKNITLKKLKKGTYYKYLVVAYKKVKGKKRTITVSKTVHATTKGGKYGVAGAVKVNRKKVVLKEGKTFTIKAKEIRAEKKVKIRPHRKISYESDNKKVATVKKGRIRAKKKGKCNIYVYAQNGVYKKIKVIVE